MDKKIKQSLMLITFSIGLYAALMNLTTLFQFAKELLKAFLPIIIGLAIAFILSVPMRGFERILGRLFQKCRRIPNEKVISVIGFLLTLVCLVLVVVLVCTIIIPELAVSTKGVCELIKTKWPEWVSILKEHNIKTENLSNLISNINFDKFFNTFTNSAGLLLGSVAGISASIASGTMTFVFALVVAAYALVGKNDLAKQGKKILYAYTPKAHADRVLHVLRMLRDAYAKFLSGQCIEAVILGVLIFVTFSIFKLPYAGLTAVLASVFAFIPYIGAYVACFVGALLTLVSNPSQVLLCIVVYLVIQFVETQFIYPRVVGKSVGLSSLWTLVATMVGGTLFGLLGIIFFIPFVAVIRDLMQESIDRRLEMKSNASE